VQETFTLITHLDRPVCTTSAAFGVRRGVLLRRTEHFLDFNLGETIRFRYNLKTRFDRMRP
jgi:hypothetical protein